MKLKFIIAAILILCFTIGCSRHKKEKRLTDFVDLTCKQGRQSPVTMIPFGYMQLKPDYTSYTQQNKSMVSSPSALHLLPTINTPQAKDNIEMFAQTYYATYSPQYESIAPGSYRVLFNNGIRTEVAVTARCGILYYEFPPETPHGMILHLPQDEQNRQHVSIKKINDRTLNGYQKIKHAGKEQRLYFHIEFSQNISVWYGNTTPHLLKKGEKVSFPKGYVWIDLGQTTDKIMVKLSTSSANTEGAAANLAQEIPHWSFDKVKRDARQEWRKVLSKIHIQTPSHLARKFYTALYQVHTSPSICSDIHGNFYGQDEEIHSIGKHTQYNSSALQEQNSINFSLLTITQRKRVNEIIRSLLKDYEHTASTSSIVQDSAEINTFPIIAVTEAYLKGIRDYDTVQAYEMVKNTTIKLINSFPKDGQRQRLAFRHVQATWCAAQFAKTLDHEEDYLYFLQNFQHLKKYFSIQHPQNIQTDTTAGTFVFKTLGFLPMTTGGYKYQLSIPLVEKATIKLEQDRKFIIKTSKKEQHATRPKAIRLNGEELQRTWITHEEITRGGTLEFIFP